METTKLFKESQVIELVPEVAEDGLHITKDAKTIYVSGETLDQLIKVFEQVEDGFKLYKITVPPVPGRFVLTNSALGLKEGSAALMSIVSGVYRVLKPSVSLKKIKDIMDSEFPETVAGTTAMAAISKGVIIRVDIPSNNGGTIPLIILNSFDRTTRETFVFAETLQLLKYQHTANGLKKADLEKIVRIALEYDFGTFTDNLRKLKFLRKNFFNFIVRGLSITPRSLGRKFFGKSVEDFRELDEDGIANMVWDAYVAKYGANYAGFVSFVNDLYKFYIAQQNTQKAIAVIRSGSVLVSRLSIPSF